MAVTDEEADGVAEGFGRSALLVAAASAVETCRSDALARDEYAEHFVRAVPACVDRPLRPDQVPGGEADPLRGKAGLLLRAPGPSVRRLSAPADRCRRASVVLLGAGLDARTYRLPWPRGCTVFEVDQEEVLAFKQRIPDGLDGLDAVPRTPGPTGHRRRRPAPGLDPPAEDKRFELVRGCPQHAFQMFVRRSGEGRGRPERWGERSGWSCTDGGGHG
ncbi:class I SAM-dependent methyltransferase [Streptomyces sp. NPDC014872]|uniref:class I SAM-dependent methyltransferase n=1 Tax=Streptomyces sp. NPDC014872 TaxID=3364926 RepID=UPI003702B999